MCRETTDRNQVRETMKNIKTTLNIRYQNWLEALSILSSNPVRTLDLDSSEDAEDGAEDAFEGEDNAHQ